MRINPFQENEQALKQATNLYLPSILVDVVNLYLEQNFLQEKLMF